MEMVKVRLPFGACVFFGGTAAVASCARRFASGPTLRVMNFKNLSLLKFLAGSAALLLLFWALCLNHVEQGEFGIARNSITGQVWTQKPGLHFTGPATRVATLPTTPFWVTFPTSSTIQPRRLVRFVPERAHDLVELQGFAYYKSSYMRGYDGGVSYLVSGYAFSGDQFSFLEVLQ